MKEFLADVIKSYGDLSPWSLCMNRDCPGGTRLAWHTYGTVKLTANRYVFPILATNCCSQDLLPSWSVIHNWWCQLPLVIPGYRWVRALLTCNDPLRLVTNKPITHCSPHKSSAFSFSSARTFGRTMCPQVQSLPKPGAQRCAILND